MEASDRQTGSVRINKEMRVEMNALGISNATEYIRYKMEQGASKQKALKTLPEKDTVRQLPVLETLKNVDPQLKDQLTIQRLSLENRGLQKKLEEITRSNEDTLNGVHHKVHSMLQEELQKRDFEALKKLNTEQKKELEELQKRLDESKKETNTKQEEIEALVKKLGFVELGKALLPGAISGLAKQYPNQMKGIAGTLGRLGLNDAPENQMDDANEQEEHLLQIMNYLQEVFTEEQFEQAIQLMIQLGDQIKEDQGLIQKITYYLNQLKEKKVQSDKEV
ncbi:hypothetical protein [Aquimarina sp. RZ0]|uniref:hypothetical protein n=1 Tax=Aquimarina sp. RZ0 TaxID=2607730 RepID=UPI0011F16223|nr:hypothetical protein [Aquimarina sp. RZ0]